MADENNLSRRQSKGWFAIAAKSRQVLGTSLNGRTNPLCLRLLEYTVSTDHH
jgi:hypothetical protein